MIYVIYGPQYPVIKKTLKTLVNNLLKDVEIDDFNYQKVSSKLVLVQDIVFDAMSLPLTSEKKVIVVTDPYYLSTEKEKVSLDKEQDFEVLNNYLNNPSEHTELIFFLEAKTLNTKSKIYPALKKNAKIMAQEVLTEKMLKQMGMAIFQKKGKVITQDALEELVNRCGDDVSKFTNEANKLCLYKDNLTIDDVKLMVSSRLEVNTFNIADALISNNISKALKIYNDLRINKQEPVMLISAINSQFRFMLEVKHLLKKSLSSSAMIEELSCNPYRLEKTIKSTIMISYEELLNIVDYLYNLDFKIKAGETDPYLGFELFLINFNNLRK